MTRRRWHRLVLLLGVAGCGAGGPTCTLIGCASQLTVQLPAGTGAVSACVAGVCTSTVSGGVLQVPLSRASDTAADLTVTVGGTTYAAQVPLRRTRPNGQACPPVCVTGTAALDVAAGTLTPVPG